MAHIIDYDKTDYFNLYTTRIGLYAFKLKSEIKQLLRALKTEQ